MTRVVGVIQARMGSTRLPGKVLMPLGGLSAIGCVIDRISACRRLDDVVVAMSDAQADDALFEEVRAYGVSAYRGSANDVLARYEAAARIFEADVLVRITADCPLVDGVVLEGMLDRFFSGAMADYMSNVMRRTFPRGLDLEVFTAGTLFQAAGRASAAYEREHVTPYIYQHPDEFRLLGYENPSGEDRSSLRLTLDTPEDYALISEIYQAFPGMRPRDVHMHDVLELLDRHPRLLTLNAAVSQKSLGE